MNKKLTSKKKTKNNKPPDIKGYTKESRLLRHLYRNLMRVNLASYQEQALILQHRPALTLGEVHEMICSVIKETANQIDEAIEKKDKAEQDWEDEFWRMNFQD